MLDIATRLHRTVKLALDDGSAASIEEATERFHQFRICIDVPDAVSVSPGLEAALLTLLNAAPRTFLGGVEIVGDVNQRLHLGWFDGMSIKDVARSFGVSIAKEPSPFAPTLLLGRAPVPDRPFVLTLQCDENGFRLSPEQAQASSPRAEVECGVAAAGAVLCEAFQYVYSRSPSAGQRTISFELPAQRQPNSGSSVWAIGLGHLGQAAMWCLALRTTDRPKSVLLQDPDSVSESNLSTCLLSAVEDVGRRKVDVVGERLERVGIRCIRTTETLALPCSYDGGTRDLALVAVDNVELRRGLDAIAGTRVVEAGIGDGASGFTRVQVHVLPGPRLAADIWAGGDPRASQAVDISAPAYQRMLRETRDECGTTLLAGRSIATPFVGAFAGACMSAIASAASVQSDWSVDVRSL